MQADVLRAAEAPAAMSFNRVRQSDLHLLRQWMQSPHWRRWWGDPNREIDQIEAMLQGKDSTEPYLFARDGQPIGYIQLWFVADARVEPWISEAPWLLDVPGRAVGIDLSIGPAGLLSKGIGSSALRAFAEAVHRRGHDYIIIDPAPDNGRAVRAYEKAGFRTIPEFDGQSEDYQLMRFRPESKSTLND